MSYSKQESSTSFEKFKAQNPLVWRRYETPAAAELLLAHLVRWQQPPSLITTELAIKALVRQGLLVRVDGITQAEENQQRLAEITAQIDQPEVSKVEVEAFLALNPRELEQRYWEHGGSNRFRVRFDKCIRERSFGTIFQAPGRPQGEADEAEAVSLTAEEYHSMGANQIIHKMKSVPGFRAAIDKLIANQEI
jgi:hypothetical protein